MDKEARLSPCSMSKENLTKYLKGWLDKDEYISGWSIDDDNRLIVVIKVKDEPRPES